MISDRQIKILEQARRDGQVSVEALAEHFGVTLQTIRRDLGDLAEAGRLERVHGGAVLPSGLSNIVYAERRALNQSAKARIAKLAAAHVQPDSAICLNIGTTTEAVAQELLSRDSLMVVTNNVHVAQILSANAACDIIMTGGTFRAADGGLTGPEAVDTIRRFRFDLAIIGCSAIDHAGDLGDFDRFEVETSRAILASAHSAILVVDHSKLSRTAPVRIANVADLDAVITDRPLPAALAAHCAQAETQVVYPCGG